jgi:hypothetical protein
MMEGTGYGGSYHDDDISVNITLEDPGMHNLDVNRLAFKVTVASKRVDGVLHVEDFKFYLMTDDNSVKNVEFTPIETIKHKDTPPPICGLIHTELMYEYLFQCLRIGVYYQPHERIHLISLSPHAV